MLYKNKKGLSDIITSLIIILLSLVAVGILWVVVTKIVSDTSEDISVDATKVNLKIKSVNIIDSDDIDIKIKREVGKGELKDSQEIRLF